MPYTPTEADLAHVDGTVSSAVSKYLDLKNSVRTPLLEDLETELAGITDSADFMSLDPDQVVFELWNDSTIRDFPFGSRPTDIQDRYTSMTIPYWIWGDDYRITDEDLRGFLSSTLFPVFWTLQGWSNYSATKVRNALIGAGSPEVYNAVKTGHMPTQVGNKLNFWSGDVLELIVKAACIDIASLVANNSNSAGVLLTTEYAFAGAEGDVADGVADYDSSFPDSLVLWPPIVGVEGTPYQSIVTDDDETYQSLWYHYQEADRYQFNRYVREIVQNVMPTMRTTEDLPRKLTEVLVTDQMRIWVLPNIPNIPLLVAYQVELIHAKNRYQGTSTRIVVGPQISTRNTTGGTSYYRATPIDLYRAFAGLSLTSGIATGLTGWGLRSIFEIDGSFKANSEVLWDYLKTLRDEVIDYLNDLIMSWSPVPRRTAVLSSVVDRDVYMAGWNYQPTIHTACNRRWQGLHATYNTYYATRWAGEPCDILLDRDLSSFSDYTVLVIPCLHVAHQDLIERIVQFIDDGGTVIVHDGSILESAEAVALGIDVGRLEILDDDYGAHAACPTSLSSNFATWFGTYNDYYEFIGKLADGINTRLPGGAEFSGVPRGVITNRLQDGDKEYIALVNCCFEYGAEEAWWRSISGMAGHVCEVGVPVSFSNPFGIELVDMGVSGEVEGRENASIGEDIVLAGGEFKIYEIALHSSSSCTSQSSSSWSQDESASSKSSISTSCSSVVSSASSSSISSMSSVSSISTSSSSIQPKNYEQIPVADVVVDSGSFSIPGDSPGIQLQAGNVNIRYTMDGTVPSATVGMLLRNGANPKSFSPEDLVKAQFFGDGGVAAELNVSY